MTTNYIIGKGELLTYPIKAPLKNSGEKIHPYTLDQAKQFVVPKLMEVSRELTSADAGGFPQDVAVAKMTLHPAYLAKSYFPTGLLLEAGFVSVGSKTVRIQPKTRTGKTAPETQDTSLIFVAGPRKAFRGFPGLAASLSADSKVAEEFAEIEDFGVMRASDRLQAGSRDDVGTFELGMHTWPQFPIDEMRHHFQVYAEKCGFSVHGEYEFRVGKLVFWPVQSNGGKIEQLANYSLVRVVRPMPAIRSTPALFRSQSIHLPFLPPTQPPLSSEPTVAILDGGLPPDHSMAPYVNRYFRSDENAADVPAFVEHGLAVTSAFLFGPISPGAAIEPPIAYVDHYRVLDQGTAAEKPFELYRALAHVEEVLLSRQYQFVNLSLGPDLAVEDDDVHAWTAVIDQALSDGATLLSVAVGNNGEGDAEGGLDRIQVPADCVNALSVGACGGSGKDWGRASYSARGPGRQPGKRKPDVLAFGGSPTEYFHVVGENPRPNLIPAQGTSFASPYVLRIAAGVRAILGNDINPLTIKALLVHGCEEHATHVPDDHGWGRVPTDLAKLVTCGDGVARIIYQGTLRPGKFLRASVPLPNYEMDGMVNLTATFCYATKVDPQDVGAYTKAGLIPTFRPNQGRFTKDPTYPKTYSFFKSAEFRSEAEQRKDLGKWETVLHASHNFRGSSLNGAVFDIHHNARDAGEAKFGITDLIPYSLVVTVEAPKHPEIYNDILLAHTMLKAIEPKLSIHLEV